MMRDKMRVLTMVAWMASIAGAVRAGEPTTDVGIDGMNELAGRPVPGHTDVFGRTVYVWRKADLLIEWGFKEGTEGLAFDGSIEATQTGMVGKAAPLPGDQRTTLTDESTWKSSGGTGRRGIVVPVLFTDATRGPARTIITVRTSSGGFSFVPAELDDGPILAPEFGFLVCESVHQTSTFGIAAERSNMSAPTTLLGGSAGHYFLKTDSPSLRNWGNVAIPGVGCWVSVNVGQEPVKDIAPKSIELCSSGQPYDYLGAGVGWRSPTAGKVDYSIDLSPASKAGAKWAIVVDRGAARKVIAEGELPALEPEHATTVEPRYTLPRNLTPTPAKRPCPSFSTAVWCPF